MEPSTWWIPKEDKSPSFMETQQIEMLKMGNSKNYSRFRRYHGKYILASFESKAASIFCEQSVYASFGKVFRPGCFSTKVPVSLSKAAWKVPLYLPHGNFPEERLFSLWHFLNQCCSNCPEAKTKTPAQSFALFREKKEKWNSTFSAF